MNDALIGYSGFVGTTLLRQRTFAARFRSTDIELCRDRTFDLVVCAGASAKKWLANREPESDRKAIHNLMGNLATIKCRMFVLVSTVDVFASPSDVFETTPVDESALHAYGVHRRLLEQFVAATFTNHLILRLPGLVGPGLKKNVIFDFLNANSLGTIDSRSTFQFYPMMNLWNDLRRALALKLQLLHLVAAPVSVAEIAREGFGLDFEQVLPSAPAHYDVGSIHAAAFGGTDRYQYDRRETMVAIRAFAQSEPRTSSTTGAN